MHVLPFTKIEQFCDNFISSNFSEREVKGNTLFWQLFCWFGCSWILNLKLAELSYSWYLIWGWKIFLFKIVWFLNFMVSQLSNVYGFLFSSKSNRTGGCKTNIETWIPVSSYEHSQLLFGVSSDSAQCRYPKFESAVGNCSAIPQLADIQRLQALSQAPVSM